ncbi:glycoside hydrolase family 16 protein [Azospirillum sp. sgz302134]
MKNLKRILLVGVAGACLAVFVAAGRATPPPKLAEPASVPAASWPLVLNEDFTDFDVARSRWNTRFLWGGRFIPGNKELQLYVESSFAGYPDHAFKGKEPLGIDPFRTADGHLVITADRAPPSVAERLGGQRYTSGLLNTEPFFSQVYGYFETRAKMPRGRGLWPAFWLLPVTGKWPPEVDVFEVLGHDTRSLHVSYHTKASGREESSTETVKVPDLSADFHVYGLLWEREKLTWFFDGRPVRQVPTPADMHQPMYLVLNLAVGGKWPGNPDASTSFPAELVVDYVRAYALPEHR